jgi:hypothetical protein
MSQHIIGLVGRAGSGKSTLARAIRDADDRFERLSFARPVKDQAREIFNLEYEATYGPSDQRGKIVNGSWNAYYWEQCLDRMYANADRVAGMFPHASFIRIMAAAGYAIGALRAEARERGDGIPTRRVLEVWGTDFGRGLDPDVWVRQLFAGLPPNTYGVVDDLRFQNEAQAIRAAGGIVVWLDAEGRLPPRAPDAHESEPDWRDWRGLVDGVFNTANTSKSADTYAKVALMMPGLPVTAPVL